MKEPEYITVTKRIPIADVDGVAIREGSVLRHIKDGDQGVVVWIGRDGEPCRYMFAPVRLLVSAEVRYWEDATVNGEEDTDGSRIPLKRGDMWKPTIELATGRVLDWPQGTTADIHYKVCDAGEYWLEDAEGKRLKYKGDYVPDDLLCMGGEGYGDYIILTINAAGIIENWNPKLEGKEWANV
jgi:hypothetical protein